MNQLILITIVGAFLIALNPVASRAETPSFFQGFEIDTSDWFPLLPAIVNRSMSGSSSSSYNLGSTSVYASGIPSATGSYNGRVTSKISTSMDPSEGSCDLDLASGRPTLRCSGPYTYWGLGDTSVYAFPSGGYSTQLDIYLDDTYAMHHPDCGQQGPCTPDMPGMLNLDCAMNPNGINCEGSRFDWDIGVDKPNGGGFLQDYVFNVGTAPDPHQQIVGCPQGWIIAASTNSFRSGANPYNLDKDPKCLSGSGWYTFQHVLMDDGTGNLEVDFSILDQSGNVVACTDETGSQSTCSWVLKPGHAIEEVGCPKYGWLSNEEINDLPIDNTVLIIDGCGIAPLPLEGCCVIEPGECEITTEDSCVELGGVYQGDNVSCDGIDECLAPPPPVRNVPTISQWGMIVVAGLLGIVGFMVIRRKKVTA